MKRSLRRFLGRRPCKHTPRWTSGTAYRPEVPVSSADPAYAAGRPGAVIYRGNAVRRGQTPGTARTGFLSSRAVAGAIRGGVALLRAESVDHLMLRITWCRFLRPGWYDSGGHFIRIVEWPEATAPTYRLDRREYELCFGGNAYPTVHLLTVFCSFVLLRTPPIEVAKTFAPTTASAVANI